MNPKKGQRIYFAFIIATQHFGASVRQNERVLALPALVALITISFRER
jgi:hypothetical protein